VDQLVPGAVRRLLVRALAVVGGVVAVTAIGWLLADPAAHADELPSTPSVPSVLSAVTAPIQHPATLPTADIKAIKTPDLKPVVQRLLPKPPLETVTKHVHATGVPLLAKPAPQEADTEPPVVRHAITVAIRPDVTEQAVRKTTPKTGPKPTPETAAHLAAPIPAPPAPGTALARHVTSTPTGHGNGPMLPPAQPDSGVHGGGGLVGGPGSAYSLATPVFGAGLALAGPESTPRLAVAPGTQPGTSPD
jgi:hypothetical protein